MRKPDTGILRLAINLAQITTEHILMIDHTAIFEQIARELGMFGIIHADVESTRVQLALIGLAPSGSNLDELR